MISDDEVENLIDLQETVMSVNESNLCETIRYFLMCPFISDSIGHEKISRAFHLAITYHPLAIPSLIQLIKLFQQEKTLQNIDHVILHLLFHYLKNNSAFPSECSSLSFIYRSYIEGVYTEDDIIYEIEHFYKTGLNFQLSLFWIFSYFTPIISKKNDHIFNSIISLFEKDRETKKYLSTINIIHQNCFTSFFDQVPTFSGENGWKKHHEIVIQKGTMSDIIRRDSIDELRLEASHPTFSIDQTITVSLFEPVWFLFDEPTLIQYSAFHHSIKCFTFCQMMNADLHLYDDKNKMLSQFAVAGGNIEIIRKVEQLGCSFNDTLHVAIGYFWFDIFLWLQQSKEIPLTIDDPVFGTILCSAAASGNLRGIRYCIENGSEVMEVNSLDKTALHYACYIGELDLVRFFLSLKDCDINIFPSPLYLAVKNGHSQTVSMLIEIPSLDINALGEDDCTSLFLATMLFYNEIVSLLLTRKDIDPNILNIGYVPLQIAVLKNNIEAVKLLVNDDRTNLNAQGKDGDTALHYAISLNEIDIVKILLSSKRIDVNAVNNELNTPLHQAALFNCTEAVDLLVNHEDIDFSITNKEIFFFLFFFYGETPYECAIDYSTTEIIDMIEDQLPDDLFDEYKNKKIFDTFN